MWGKPRKEKLKKSQRKFRLHHLRERAPLYNVNIALKQKIKYSKKWQFFCVAIISKLGWIELSLGYLIVVICILYKWMLFFPCYICTFCVYYSHGCKLWLATTIVTAIWQFGRFYKLHCDNNCGCICLQPSTISVITTQLDKCVFFSSIYILVSDVFQICVATYKFCHVCYLSSCCTINSKSIIWHVSYYDGHITFYLCEDSSFCWNDLDDIIDMAFSVQINPDDNQV